MEHNPNMNSHPARSLWKTTWVVALALFLLTPSLLICATSSVPRARALHYPAIIIYVGSG